MKIPAAGYRLRIKQYTKRQPFAKTRLLLGANLNEGRGVIVQLTSNTHEHNRNNLQGFGIVRTTNQASNRLNLFRSQPPADVKFQGLLTINCTETVVIKAQKRIIPTVSTRLRPC